MCNKVCMHNQWCEMQDMLTMPLKYGKPGYDDTVNFDFVSSRDHFNYT